MPEVSFAFPLDVPAAVVSVGRMKLPPAVTGVEDSGPELAAPEFIQDTVLLKAGLEIETVVAGWLIAAVVEPYGVDKVAGARTEVVRDDVLEAAASVLGTGGDSMRAVDESTVVCDIAFVALVTDRLLLTSCDEGALVQIFGEVVDSFVVADEDL